MLQTLKNKSKRIAQTFAAGVLLFSQFAVAPSVGATNFYNTNEWQYWCSANYDGGVKFDHPNDGTISGITADFHSNDKQVDISSDSSKTVGLVVVNGGSNDKTFTQPPFTNMSAPLNGGGNVPTISHVIVCYDNVKTTVEVVKKLNPSNDPGKFELYVNGTKKADNVGNDGTTGKVDIDDHSDLTVSEKAESGTSLSDYTTTAVCKVGSSTLDVEDSNLTSSSSRYLKIDSHDIDQGDTVVCTFTNSKNAPTTGSLVVKKNVVNDNGNTKKYSDFHYTNNGTTFTLSADNTDPNNEDGVNTTSFKDLPAGTTFNVAETDANTMGYTTTYDGCTGTIVAGQTVTCTITNDDQDPLLTLQKVVVKDNGGTAHASDWTLKAQAGNNAPAINTAPSVVSVDTTTNSTAATTATDVAPGSYTLSETGGPSGYAASDWTCDGGTLVGNTVTVTYGDHVTCTITNDDIAPKLTVNKSVTNDNGGTLNPSNFPLAVSGMPVLTGVQQSFNAGTYTVSEEQQDGYKLTGWGGACDFGGAITLALGGVYTCNLYNDDQPATIKVTKVVVNDNGGHAKAKDWTLKVGDTVVKSGDVNTFSGNAEYTISESDGPKGYEQTDLTCYDTTAETTVANPFTAKLGHNYECTITNDDIAPKLTIVKDAQPNSPQAFTFDLQRKFGEYHETFQLKDGFFLPWLTNNKTFTLPHSGLYTVTEQATDGWYLDDLTCWNTEGWSWTNTDVDASKATVKLGIGDEVTCKFVNNKYGHIDGVKFNDINKNGKYDWNFGGGTPEPLISDWTINLYQDEELVQTTTTNKYGIYSFDNLKPGTYTLCEAQQDGWVQTVPGDNERTPDGCYTIHVYPGTSKHDVKFGNFQYATVSGIKFNDVNGNGKRDDGEPTLASWTIKLTKTCPVVEAVQTEQFLAPACEETTQTTTTDANGEYSFTNLDLGTYQVCEVQQDKWVQTYPSKDGCYDFTVDASSQTFTDKDFGNHPVPQVLSETTTLVNTGASTAIGTMAGLTILGLLGGLYFVTRRKSYQN